MSISKAVAEFERTRKPVVVPLATAIFKARQRALEDLIGETETEIAGGAFEVLPPLRAEVRRVLALIEGRIPPWLDEVETLEALLDHLFIAEGELRQDHYTDRRIRLDPPA